jgi:hypothetical protein
VVENLGQLLAELKTDSDQATAFDFHVGTVVAFNSASGANVIRIRGALIPDVPLLNIGDTVNLTPDDNVIVLKYRTGYFILGRVVQPNSEHLATDAVDFDGYANEATNFSLSTTHVSKVTQLYYMPAWASGALLNATVMLNAKNTTAGTTFFYTRMLMQINDGAEADVSGSGMFSNNVPAGEWGFVSSTFSQALTIVPGTKLLVTGQARADDAVTAESINRISLNVSWSYRRNGAFGVPPLSP